MNNYKKANGELLNQSTLEKHFNSTANKRFKWRKRFSYYYNYLEKYFSFFIPPNSKIIEIGCGTGELLASLKPSLAYGIDISGEAIKIAKKKFPKYKFLHQNAEKLELKQKFEYIVISDLLGDLKDIQSVFKSLHKISNKETKLIISYYNKLWEPILKFTELIKLKTPQLKQNWISANDLTNLLVLSDFEIIKEDRKIIFPLQIPFISYLINNILGNLPIIRNLCLIKFVHARIRLNTNIKYNCSVIIPARNEKGNIENAIKQMPIFDKKVEIIFVEGHSKDKTYEEIVKVKKKYKSMNIKYFKQSGIGKGNAVREGFKKASGEILMILDADLTVHPKELIKFYNAIKENKGEFINGSRFVYPMEKSSMRFLNTIGNKFFTSILSYAINQKLTDTLCGTKVLLKKNYLKIEKNRSFFGEFDPFGDFDLIFGASKLDLKIIDIPIRYKERVYGSTQINRFQHGFLLLKMTIFALFKIKLI